MSSDGTPSGSFNWPKCTDLSSSFTPCHLFAYVVTMDPSLTGRENVGPDLGSVLMEQRMRADKHRMNFEALRSQYIVLQEVGGGGGGVRWWVVEGVGSGGGWWRGWGQVVVEGVGSGGDIRM